MSATHLFPSPSMLKSEQSPGRLPALRQSDFVIEVPWAIAAGATAWVLAAALFLAAMKVL
jgi:hypothetical protein